MKGEKNELDHDFDTFLNRVQCFNVMNQKYEDRCNFVLTVPDCNESSNYVPFMIHLLECRLKTQSRFAEWVLIFVMVFFAFYLGLIIAIVANSFFGPALKIVAKILRMSEHLAGVSLLAFGNSADELLSHIANIGKGEQLIANCMSKSIFLTMVAGGLVCYLRPFQMNGYETIRDVMFFIAGLLFMDFTVRDGAVDRIESACYIGIYVVFIIVNIIDIYLENRELKKKIVQQPGDVNTNVRNEPYKGRRQTSVIDFVHRPSSARNSKIARGSSRFSFTTRISKSPEYVDTEATKKALYNSAHSKNYNLFRDFLNSINPFDGGVWSESSICMKLFLILKAPVCLITQICIPIVDVEADKHGWSKLLNCIQIIINVPMGLVLTENEEYLNYMLYSVILTTPIAIFVLFHSRTDLPPFYHYIFAFLACTGSLFFIFASATKIEAVLTVIGSFLALSKDFCGATIWGWGFAVSDAIANVVLALQGYEGMAFAACIGGPFFTLLVSTGIVYSVESWENTSGVAKVDSGLYGENAFVFLMLALSSTLVFASTFNFQARRCIGIFSLCLYGLYLIFAILSEKEVIHTFKRDDIVRML